MSLCVLLPNKVVKIVNRACFRANEYDIYDDDDEDDNNDKTTATTMMTTTRHIFIKKNSIKISHTADTNSLDRCKKKHRYQLNRPAATKNIARVVKSCPESWSVVRVLRKSQKKISHKKFVVTKKI